ncbi:FAD:protein FMN transferase [Sediminibacterium roseum]|uniref:FAD:protein FMN transferase n=1 Tax=Sediminibacterium roseum TaxID=1978412 RepID=A0ABW9ZRE2_9BACT|nr:FAD:protein FMN transferase [Sediminibacterium roseum]NCI49668.1 FAD:protein FMN transferase [Sediminibacterium roseum]
MPRSLICFLFPLLTAISTQSQEKKFHFSAQKMGSPFNIILVSGDSLKAAAVAEKCFALVDSFNLIYSDYDTASELSKINRLAGAGEVRASAALWEILVRSRAAWQKSKGAFDITVGPLARLWRKTRKEKTFPSAETVNTARALTGFKRLEMHDATHTVALPVKGMALDLGGIAKGYVAQKVLGLISAMGFTMALVDAGGDMVMSGAPPGSGGWTVGVNIPETTDRLLPRRLLLSNKAVATSGDAYQYVEHDGIKYSHIIDPRTGYGIASQRNVTVIAGNGADADWLATACSILPVEQSKKLASALHADLLITELKEGKIIYHSTTGFAKYWKH